MNSQKQLLRVLLKLMSFVAVSCFLYVFISGLLSNGDSVLVKELVFDLPQIPEGGFTTLSVNNRKLLLLHLSDAMRQNLKRPDAALYRRDSYRNEELQEWLAVYAIDPLFGCEIELSQDKRIFQAVCSPQKYNLAGRPYSHQQSQLDLLRPEYKILQQKIVIRVD